VQRGPLADDLAPRARILDLVRRDAGEVIGRFGQLYWMFVRVVKWP
jgi:hypothetical protein